METPEANRKKRSLVVVCLVYAIVSLLMVAGVVAMAKYMDQS
jgi:hypothetical protein